MVQTVKSSFILDEPFWIILLVVMQILQTKPYVTQTITLSESTDIGIIEMACIWVKFAFWKKKLFIFKKIWHLDMKPHFYLYLSPRNTDQIYKVIKNDKITLTTSCNLAGELKLFLTYSHASSLFMITGSYSGLCKRILKHEEDLGKQQEWQTQAYIMQTIEDK